MKRVFMATVVGVVSLFSMQSSYAADMKVGLLLPYSGVYAALGKEIDAGFELGLEKYGSDLGLDIEIVREDTEVKPPVAISKTKKLILQDKVQVIAGVVSSGVLGALRDIITSSKVPLVVANAGNDEATGSQCSPYITRMSFSNSQVNRPMGKWMFDQGIKKVFTLAPDYAAGRQMIDAFTESFKAAGGEIVGQEFTPFQKTQDFGPYLTKAQASDADAVYVFYAGGEAISFVKQYDSFGIKVDKPLYGSGFLTSQLYVNAQGPAAAGVITALHYVPAIDTPENLDFVTSFIDKTGHIPSEFAVHGYDAAHAIVEALKSGATDRESLAKALSQVSFDGPRGELKIDPTTNNLVQPIYVYQTSVEGSQATQTVLATLPAEPDPANGCNMSALMN